MLKFLRNIFAYQLSRKVTTEEFVQIGKDMKLADPITVAAKLDAGDLVDITTGKVLFVAGKITHEEVLFKHSGMPVEADLASLYLKTDQRVRWFQEQLPSAQIVFGVIFLPAGSSIPVTEKTKKALQLLGAQTGVI